MCFADWLIVLIPTALVMGIGIYSRRLICGLFDMFRCLHQRVANPLDNGMVEGNMLLDGKAQLEAIDRKPEGK